MADRGRPRIAVFAGPNATVLNTEPLVTSNKARARHGLPPRVAESGHPLRFDVLRPQRLAAPVIVYVERFSAHPLEHDAAELYGPPDGYLDVDGRFHAGATGEGTPVYEIELRPEDGLYPLPYMARQADGRPWEGDEADPWGPRERARQPFFPDSKRLFEEIDRLLPGDDGVASHLSAMAEFDHLRAAPPGGYTKADPPEQSGRDFFPYRPVHLLRQPSRRMLAEVTNTVQRALSGDRYAGGLWLEGSPLVEDTAYWLGLLIDSTAPIAACASQRPHGAIGNDGDRNIIDAVTYLTSDAWADEQGRDAIGPVVAMDQLLFSARQVQKADARPGGYVGTGGLGGVVGMVSRRGRVVLGWRPVRRHTWQSEVRLTALPDSVQGVTRRDDGSIKPTPVRVRDAQGELLAEAMPAVSIVKGGHFGDEDERIDPDREVAIAALVDRALSHTPLAGIVAEGTAPYGTLHESAEAALRTAVHAGLPVVKVARGNADGFVDRTFAPFAIAGGNLTATKARLLLMACLLRLGAPPAARDPSDPTRDETGAVRAVLERYQGVFDQH